MKIIKQLVPMTIELSGEEVVELKQMLRDYVSLEKDYYHKGRVFYDPYKLSPLCQKAIHLLKELS
jgi:hypothetical protein